MSQKQYNSPTPPPDPIECKHEHPVDFPHPSERELAQILDFYQIPWEYEPKMFALEWDDDRTSARRFRPISTCRTRICTSS